VIERIMVSPDVLDKLNNIARQSRQSNRGKNDSDFYVREVVREAKNAHIADVMPVEHIEARATEYWLSQLPHPKMDYPLDILSVASQRRNHRLMLKLLRHPDDVIRQHAADQFQILFAMMDDYYDEASSVVNQILLLPTEIPQVKYALLRDAGRSSRRGLPRGIADTARRLIHDVDQVVSYHALRVLSALYDVRDWKAVLDRMVSLVGETDDASEYFLSAGVEYLQMVVQHEPAVVDWLKSLLDTYGPEHMAIGALESFVRRNLDVALEVGLINKRVYQEMKGT
jgi:hypothetical protein